MASTHDGSTPAPLFPLAGALLAWLACACAAPSRPTAAAATVAPAGQGAFDPSQALAIEWKQRVDVPYLYVEHEGDYRAIGASFGRLLGACEAAGIEAAGPIFALYYDDPGRVPSRALLARACVPVADVVAPRGILRFDVVPSEPVAYAIVPGPYSGVPRSYPLILEYMRDHGWQLCGPVRECYLNPEAIQTGGELLTEVQLPWTAAE